MNPHALTRAATCFSLPFRAVARYISENPIRAGLTTNPAEYPYVGALLPGFPTLNIHSPKYWDLFWGTHAELLKANGYEG